MIPLRVIILKMLLTKVASESGVILKLAGPLAKLCKAKREGDKEKTARGWGNGVASIEIRQANEQRHQTRIQGKGLM